jgi:hypothetical protein
MDAAERADERLVAISIGRSCDVLRVEAIAGWYGRRHADAATWVVERGC